MSAVTPSPAMPCGAAGSGGSGPVPLVPSMGRTHGTTHQATTAAACESQSGEKGESCHTDKHVGAGVPAAYADGPRQADASAATSPPPGASLQPSERSASTDADDSPPPCGAVNPVSLQSSCPVSTASSPESAGASGSSSAPLSSALTSLQSDSRQPLSSSAFLSAAGQPASSLDDRDAAQPAAVSHQGASAPGGDGKGVSSPAVNTIALAEILHGFDCVRGELFLSEEERQMLQHALKPYHFRLVPSLSARALAGGPGGRKGFSKRVASGAGPSRRLTQEVQRLQQAACSFAALPRGKRRQSKANSRYQDDDTSSSVAGADKSERRGSMPYDESGARSGANQSADGVGEAGAGRGPQYLTGGEFWMGPQGQFGHSAGSPGSGGEKTVSVVSDDASTVSRNSRAGGKGDRRTGGRRSRQMAGVGEEAFGVAGGARGREDPDHVADEGRHSAAGGARGRKRKLRQERDEVSDPQGGWADEDREDQKYRRRVRTGKGDTGPPSGASAAASGFEGIAFTPILRSMPWRESCMLILQHLKRHTAARWFLAPVDPELDGVPGYLEVISRPMDFGTIERKLRGGPRVYVHPSQWQQDVRQVFFNAFSFHPVSHDVWQDAAILAAEFERCCLQTDQVNPYYASTLAASGAAGACAGAEAPHDRFPSSSEAAGPAAGFAASAAAASRASPAAASVARGGPSQTYAPYYASASAPAVQPLHDNASWTSLEGTDAAAASHVSASAASGRTGRGGPGRARRQAGQHFETSTHVSDAYYGGVYGGAPQPTASASAGGSGGGKGRLRGAASGVLGSPRRGGRGRGRGRGAAAQLLQRCHTWGETSPKNGPYMVGHQVLQSGGRGRGGGFGGVPPYGSVQGAGAVPGGGGQMGVGIDPQAVWEAEAPPNAPLLPPPPVPRIGVNDKPLSASQKRVLDQNMTRLSSLQRKAALELIQDDLGILASEYMDEKEFVFDTELLSIEKQKRLFAYVNSMVRANRELWLQQQQVAANLGGAAAYRAQGGGSTASSAGGSPYPVGGEGASGVPGKGAGTEARRGKKKRDERNGAGSDSSSSDSDSSCSSSSSSFSDSSSASSSDSDDSDDTDDEKADADDAKKQARAAAASASTADEAIAMPTSQSKDGSSWNRDANSTALLPGAGVGHHAVAGGEPAAAPSSGAAASSGGTADGGAQLLTVSGSSGGPPSERASPPPGVSSSHQADFPGASAATAPRDGHASAAERLAAEGGAAAVATSREEGRREDASGSVPGQGEGMEPAAHAASCGAGAAARSGGLPQYTPVCEEGSDEIREEVMGRHADFFGAFDSQAPEEGSEETVGSQGLTAEAKSTAWKEWKGQVIQQGFVAQRAYATQDRSVNEIIAEGYDARI